MVILDRVLVLAVVKLVFASGQLVPLPNFESRCETGCPLQNQTEDGHGDVGCGPECKIIQCAKGCELWQKAVHTSCQVVCNGTQELLPVKELYCVMGCNDAVNRYFHQLKELIGTPHAPALVADTLTATSLRLEWDGVRFVNISYLVQWRYEEWADQWQYCHNQTWGPHATVSVDNLQPYTKYRFRVVLLLSPHHGEPIASAPSLVISTLPGGAPSSPPRIVRTTAADPTRVSVSWAAGPFPNGPLLSYVLQINQLPRGYTALKDIPATENKDFYMFQNLAPAGNYSVSVSMRNAAGLGPPAIAYVTTPEHSQVKETHQLILILGAQHTVISQAADLLGDPVEMYKTTHRIKGVALHVRRELLFVSDSSGMVWVTSSRDYSSPSPLLSPGVDLAPHDLSVDWLNDQLYILALASASSLWQVMRCNLDGSGVTVAVAGFVTKPHHMEVDPYNGYLFWVVQGAQGGGLYRLDLSDISNGVKHEVIPDQILSSPHLGAFTVDHKSFRILVPNQELNTVVAVSLDGHEVTDVRANTQQPQFRSVISLAMADGLFYWTNGERVLTEEYHAGQASYYHNLVYTDTARPLFVSVNLPSSQPVPVPVNPPTALQAVLGSHSAKSSWQSPHLLGGQGKGAWQNWSYQLSVREVASDQALEWRDINSTWHTVHELKPATEYAVRAAAYTSAGVGPWSSEFRGHTLRYSVPSDAPVILWSAAEGLLKSDVTGESVTTLILRDNLKDRLGSHYITDITWFRDQLYLVTNTSHVHWFNVTSRRRGRLRDLESVGSIAVDWVGRRLYWSNPKQQLIIRGNLNGSQQEPLPILTVARELNVDGVKGFIYWSTGHAVESARLNGKHKNTYYPAELFSGKQVMGLTVDVDARAVYWIVRSYEGSALFCAPTADQLRVGEVVKARKVSTLQYPNMQGPLCYFDRHLVWMRDDRYAVIGDMRGQNSAVLSGMSLSALNMVAVMDPALHAPPRDRKLSDVNVIPSAVGQSSLRVEGTPNKFTIVWDQVTNVNYGQVFYEIKIRNLNKKDMTRETTNSFWEYETPGDFVPFSPLYVSVRALTYWGASPYSRALLHSPPSAPSQPTNPRVFVTYNRNPVKQHHEVIAVFRWDAPLSPNGIIVKYQVSCWLEGAALQPCDNTELSANVLEYVVPRLPQNSTIFFKVAACTEVGCSSNTLPAFGDSSVETPVPRLLVSSGDTVQITDCDRRENVTLSRGGGVIDLAYSSHDGRAYWIDESDHLVTTTFYNDDNTKELLKLNKTGLSVAVDWVGRLVYWAERGVKRTSAVHVLDLNRPWFAHKHVVTRPHPVVRLAVDPLASMLYWVEERLHGIGTLMKSHADGTGIHQFFPSSHPEGSGCTCGVSAEVGGAVSVDHSEPARPRLLFVDHWTNHVMAATLDGCHCHLLVNTSTMPHAGLPPTSMTADHRLVYWSNATEGRIYSLAKRPDSPNMVGDLGLTALNATGIRHISALGSHLQPYPNALCLTPSQSGPLRLVNRTVHSLSLDLPIVQSRPGCGNVSLATVVYKLSYGPGCHPQRNPDHCTLLETFSRLVTVENLEEQTEYSFHLAFGNHYTQMQGAEDSFQEPVVIATFSSEVSPAQNVSAVVLSPRSLRVRWVPVGGSSYHVFWRRGGRVEGMHLDAITAQWPADNTTLRCADMTDLEPGQEYVLWVRGKTGPSQQQESDSAVVRARTYRDPQPITLVAATASSLNISWTRPLDQPYIWYEVECFSLMSQEWSSVKLHHSTNTSDFYFIDQLTPKTQYSFRLKILYTNLSEPYIWPLDFHITFETLGDRPSPPGTPVLHQLKGNINQVMWEEPDRDHGGRVDCYWLEGRTTEATRARREADNTPSHEAEPEWTLYYNGSKPDWIMAEAVGSARHQFRVRARNRYGWSEWSAESQWFAVVPRAAALPGHGLGVVVWVLTPLTVLALVFTLMCLMCTVVTRREKDKKTQHLLNMNTNIIRAGSTDVELANLRELPRRPNFVQNSNALYTAADLIPTDREIAMLPHIRREHITLARFLGSGAFGEVFEGKALNLPDLPGVETKVAVKTLRKGASQQEKLEFLKEAQLMSNFKHENILQLLGVCLDNDPNFIIMELMEAGDLLVYLRSHRPLTTTESSLSLLDLLSMCVDVARGCCYLEEMHFVHRDLACRNCLVSSPDPQTRVVKIGDFGLARDIYKNDYYRKEGEGLLPVRWMSPESLVDGVFTSQSDVWAFGVLLWEIMTLGQQPYPARNNLEVLHYVRNGGRLNCPPNCCQQMYDLMLRCWSFNSEERPTFKHCLGVLSDLQRKALSGQPLGDQSAPAATANHQAEKWRSEREFDTGGSHKYLELLYDEDESGYEVPRPKPGPADDATDSEPDPSSMDQLLPSLYSNLIKQLSMAETIGENNVTHDDIHR